MLFRSDAVAPAKETRLGVGGRGGNGGGGQGGAGGAAIDTLLSGYDHGTDPGMPSRIILMQKTAEGRGLGSNGGVGGDGCILVYY